MHTLVLIVCSLTSKTAEDLRTALCWVIAQPLVGCVITQPKSRIENNKRLYACGVFVLRFPYDTVQSVKRDLLPFCLQYKSFYVI